MDVTTTPDAQGAADGMLGNPPPASPAPVSGGIVDSAGPTSADFQSESGNVVPPPAKSTPAATPTAPTHLNTFDRILDAMGGRPKPTYQVNPQTGKLEPGPPAPMSTSQRLGMVVAAALTGLAASERQPGRKTGLSTFATGAGAELSQHEQDDADAKQQAIADFKRKQEMQNQADDQTLKKAQIFETNARTVLTTRTAERTDQDIREHFVQSSQPIIDQAREASVNGQSALLREHLTQDQLLQEHSQPGARHGTSNVYIPDGEIEAIDPKTGEPQKNPDGSARMEYTFAELDPNAQIELDSADLDKASRNGMPVPGYTPGSNAKLLPDPPARG